MNTEFERLNDLYQEAVEKLCDLENRMRYDEKEYRALEKEVEWLRNETLIHYVD